MQIVHPHRDLNRSRYSFLSSVLIMFTILSVMLLPVRAVATRAGEQPLAISTFDSDNEGWSTLGDAQEPSFSAINGNPGGYIYASDKRQGVAWYWQAPMKFLGHKSAAYGTALTFDLKQSTTSSQDADQDDVILVGGGITLWFNTFTNPGTDWTAYTIMLNETAGWVKPGTNQVPTQAELQQVLASLTSLHIRGEFSGDADTGSLDNVVIGVPMDTQTSPTSTFDKGGEGWGVVGDAQAPLYAATGGNPGGYVYAADKVTGASWHWKAPLKFLGNKSATYGKILAFDLKQSIVDRQIDDKDDVILVGGGITLWFNITSNPGINWTKYSILLREDAGWKKAGTDQTPSQIEMQQVLAALASLQIRGEFRDGADIGGLDNVIFNSGDITTFRPPLLIVHGIQTLSLSGYSCNQGVQPFHSNSTLGNLPEWFINNYDVQIAHLSSNALHTPSIESNAQCLRDQIAQVYNSSGGRKVTIVAHSMGGLVSRACLSLADCRSKVRALYTLGSPHGGLNWEVVSKIILKLTEKYLLSQGIPIPVGDGVCVWQQALCQMSTESMAIFNASNYNQYDISYTFIGGDVTPRWPGWLVWPTEGANDGVVGSKSAVGWLSRTGWFFPPNWADASKPEQYWTKNTHVESFGDAYYEQNGSIPSQAYACILYEETSNEPSTPPDVCRKATGNLVTMQSTPPILSQTTTSFDGQIATGQIVTRTVEVDTSGATLFSTAWVTGTMRLTLKRPDGQTITPEYAAANPLEVTYNTVIASPEFPPLATYTFTSTIPGTWQITLQAVDVGSTASGYVGFVAMETDRVLQVNQNANLYKVGDTATFTATLQRAGTGINGATVTAKLRRPDGVDDTITLADIGSGVYRANYAVPNAGGHVAMEVVAVGSDGGTSFTRQVERIWAISPNAAQFTGVVRDRGADRNGNGRFDVLLVDVPITVTQPATYTLAARLTKGDVHIASTAVYTEITTPGTYTFQLAFDGKAISAAQLNGPYTVTSAILTDANAGGVPVTSVDVLHTTTAYTANQFELDWTNVLYLPMMLRN